MPYNHSSNLWPKSNSSFFASRTIEPIRQSGPHCVSTCLAMQAGKKPEDFQNSAVNTQDPVSWSDALRAYDMKLAYYPFSFVS